MEHSGERDFLFCEMCGSLLSLRSVNFAKCDLCGFKRSMKDSQGPYCMDITLTMAVSCAAVEFSTQFRIENHIIAGICGKAISFTVVAEDIRRELGISIIEEQKVELAKVGKKCEKCGHNEAAYYTRQMRSADEGQTTFYTCTRCSHKFQEN